MHLPALFASRLFLVSLVLLVAAGAVVPTLVASLQERFGKLPIEIRRTLHEFDVHAMPSFQFIEGVRVIGSGPEWVGTEEMFTHAFEPREWDVAGGERPGVILFVTYYSDPNDTIPHTPEVCYRQAGGEVRRMITVPFEVPGRDDGPFQAYALDIGVGDANYTVVYFFYHNGRIMHDRERLRFIMSMPGDRHTYFSKLESAIVRLPSLSFEDSIEPCLDLLIESLAELAGDHFPLDEAVRR